MKLSRADCEGIYSGGRRRGGLAYAVTARREKTGAGGLHGCFALWERVVLWHCGLRVAHVEGR